MMSGLMGGGSGLMGGMFGKYGGKIKYQMGGQMPMEGMGLNELMGPTHNEGGMTISPETEVEGGETILESENYVFSDSIKVPGKNKTFAQESKTIKTKYKLRPDDKLSKESMKAELDGLMASQEETRAEMMTKDQEKFQSKMMMKYGGYMLDRNMQPMEMQDGGRMFQMGSYLNDDNNPKNLWSNTATELDIPPQNIIPNFSIEDPYNKETIQKNRANRLFDDKSFQQEQVSRLYNNDYDLSKRNVDGGINFTKKDKKDKEPFDFDSLRMPNSAIAGIAAGLKGMGKQKPLLTPQAQVNYINTRPAEILAEQQGELGLAAGLAGLKDNATTQGNYLANVANMAAASGMGTGANVGNIRFQGDTQNIGIANQGALQRQATIAANNALLRQAKTAELLRRDKMLDDASRTAQTASTDKLKEQNQKLLLNLTAQDRFKYDDEGNMWMKVNPGTDEEDWVKVKTSKK
jgi:hypothetical protein